MSKVGRSALFLFVAFGITITANAQSNFNTANNYKADWYTSPNSILSPRSVARDESGDILVVSQGASNIAVIYEDGDKTVKTAVIIEGTKLGLNHGLFYDNGYLYASTSGQVLRWGYMPGERTKVTAGPEVIVRNIPADGDHQTRTLIVDRYNRLYVSVGSAENVGKSETRAQIRRFNLAEGVPAGGYEYQDGEIFANGVRNAVGLTFDSDNLLWGVDCGADQLERKDLGNDIHNTNPADELMIFEVSGASYGYPYCWTVGDLKGHQTGQQYAWPDFMNDTVHTDAWCQNIENNRPPILPLPAHNAPLGLVFYDGVGCESQPGSFPCSMKGDLFIAFHGSWNRQPPSGYKLVRVPINSETRLPSGKIEDIVFEANPSTCIKCFRPVDLVFSQNGHIILSSDASNEIIRVTYKGSYDSGIGDITKTSLYIPGIFAIMVILIFTTCMIIMTVKRFCCRRTEEVPYMKENI